MLSRSGCEHIQIVTNKYRGLYTIESVGNVHVAVTVTALTLTLVSYPSRAQAVEIDVPAVARPWKRFSMHVQVMHT
jgi:hypothetical protein